MGCSVFGANSAQFLLNTNRLTVVGPDPDSRPCPGARLVEREVVRDGRTVWVEEWRVTVSSVGELLELQSGLGAPVLLEGVRLTVMAEGA